MGDAGSSTLSFLTWNLAMLERSAQAPIYWESSATEAAVRDVVLELAPDVVCYQELPGLVPFVETHSMIPANPKSHSGNLATLVRNELATTELKVGTVDGCAVLTTFVDLDLTVANVHLPAGRSMAPERLMYLSKIIDASPTKPLLIVGDTNMRIEEAERFSALGFSGDKPPAPTWDSRRNRFRDDAPEFSAYFTRWFASPGLSVTDVRVHAEPLEHDDRRFHLSDHFALGGTIVLPDPDAN